jgi:hypothetical protein
MMDGYHMTDLRRAMTSDITVTVGSGGDFSTINDAINYLVNNFLPPCYRTNSGTPKAKIRILSGTTIAEQIVVDGIDLSWITIVSVDYPVPVNGNSLQNAYFSLYPFIIAMNGAKLPVINTKFYINPGKTGAVGIYLCNRAQAYIGTYVSGNFEYEGGIKCAEGVAALRVERGSTIIAEYVSAWEGNSRDTLNYAIQIIDSIAFLPYTYLNKANTLIRGLRSFIRILDLISLGDYYTKLNLSKCDCIPSS